VFFCDCQPLYRVPSYSSVTFQAGTRGVYREWSAAPGQSV